MNLYKNVVIFYSSFVNLAEILLKAFSSFSMPSCLCFCLWPLGKLAVAVDPQYSSSTYYVPGIVLDSINVEPLPNPQFFCYYFHLKDEETETMRV